MADTKKVVVTNPKSVDENGNSVKKAKDTGEEDKIAEYKPYYGLLHGHSQFLYSKVKYMVCEQCAKGKDPRPNGECSHPYPVLQGDHFEASKFHANGCPAEAYRYAQDTAKLSFMGMTEHSNSFIDHKWKIQGKMADRYREENKNKLIAFRGFEMSFNVPVGHLNTFNTDGYVSRYDMQQKYDVKSWLIVMVLNILKDTINSSTLDNRKEPVYLESAEEAETIVKIIQSTKGENLPEYKTYMLNMFERLKKGAYKSAKYNTEAIDKRKPKEPNNSQVVADVHNYIYVSVMLKLMQPTYGSLISESVKVEIYYKLHPKKHEKDIENVTIKKYLSEDEKADIIDILTRDKKDYRDAINLCCENNIITGKEEALKSLLKDCKIPFGNRRITITQLLKEKEALKKTLNKKETTTTEKAQLQKEIVQYNELGKKIFRLPRRTFGIHLLGLELVATNVRKRYEDKKENSKEQPKVKYKESISTMLYLLDYYKWLISNNSKGLSITQFNHPTLEFGDFFEFAFYKPVVNRIRLLELYTTEKGKCNALNGRYLKQYIQALSNGWMVAPTFAQDTHHKQWGTGNNLRTAVLLPANMALDINTLFDAIRKRHVYATDSDSLFMDLSILTIQNNNAAVIGMMGDEVILNLEQRKVSFRLIVKDKKHAIKEVQFLGTVLMDGNCRKKGFKPNYKKEDPHNWKVTGDLLNVTNNSFFLATVAFEDGRFGISAPIWINYKGVDQQAILDQL
jgi:hypothetical protein